MEHEGEPRPEFVITGPGQHGPALAYRTRGRTTIGVLIQLFIEARRRVIVSAPYLQAGYGLSAGPLREAMRTALQRGVNVDAVSTGESLRTLNLPEVLRGARGTLRLFRPLSNIQDESRLGSHAKFCLADGTEAYVGSANLTGPGLSEHIEMGLLVRGQVARQIWEFWEYCLDLGLFIESEPQ
jgi:phosphatidylserine/phosphatidylglycerophosphate/cardiolipin synthase-like enzyme